ncbi:MAG TPA: hypothetical protein PLQ34_07810 [Ferrovaceae bacterium]|nr:hypothetical protein [Ferrovaceae bacterium]
MSNQERFDFGFTDTRGVLTAQSAPPRAQHSTVEVDGFQVKVVWQPLIADGGIDGAYWFGVYHSEAHKGTAAALGEVMVDILHDGDMRWAVTKELHPSVTDNVREFINNYPLLMRFK